MGFGGGHQAWLCAKKGRVHGSYKVDNTHCISLVDMTFPSLARHGHRVESDVLQSCNLVSPDVVQEAEGHIFVLRRATQDAIQPNC